MLMAAIYSQGGYGIIYVHADEKVTAIQSVYLAFSLSFSSI